MWLSNIYIYTVTSFEVGTSQLVYNLLFIANFRHAVTSSWKHCVEHILSHPEALMRYWLAPLNIHYKDSFGGYQKLQFCIGSHFMIIHIDKLNKLAINYHIFHYHNIISHIFTFEMWMFRIGLKSPKSFVLRFINYYLKSVWATFPVSMSKHQYPVCAFISLDFLEIVQWTSQFLHTWVNLTTNNTGYSGVIICKWDWMCVWLYSTDWHYTVC